MKRASFVCLFPFLVATLFAQNPIPFIDLPLVPDAVAPGGPQFTLTVNGAGFVSSSVVRWNGSPLASRFVSSSQLTAIVPAADITTASTARVTVVNPALGGGTSNVASFTVTANEGNAVGFSQVNPVVTDPAPSMVVGDFNGDGIPDLAVLDNDEGYDGICYVFILLGDGNGNFTTTQQSQFLEIQAGYSAVALAVGDFNGDGNLDLVTANGIEADGGITIFTGDGNGNFYGHGVGTGNALSAVAVGDFNGDGNLDFAVVSWGPPSTVSVYLGDGSGSNFALASTLPVGTTATAVVVGDFNGDGILDLAVLDQDNNGLFILLGDGTGNFTLASTVAVGGWSVATGDFNGDGKQDLAVANNNGSVSILLGDGTGNFTLTSSFLATGPNGLYSVAVSDLNGDGNLDLAVSAASNTVYVLLGDGTGNFNQAPPPSLWGGPTISDPVTVVISDFNGDGKLDMATANLSSYFATIMLQQSSIATIFPASLAFGNLPIGTTSAPQIVQLSTNSPLNITSISTSAGFAQTNNCGSSLPADGSCQISVTFTPTVSGNRTGTLTELSGSAYQYVQLSGSSTLTTGTTLTSSLNPSLSYQPVTFTAAVSGQSGGTPTGTVTFSDGSTTLATVTLSGGTAAFSTEALPVGLNSVTAVYSGDANFAGSTSAVLGETVNTAAPPSLQAIIAGSTAFWSEAGEAAYTLGGTTTTCAWTTSAAVDDSSFVIDQRVPPLPQYLPQSIDYGPLWVTWTPGTAGGTCAAPDSTSQVWAYIGLDSVVGDRCFFAQPQCTLYVGRFNETGGVSLPAEGVITPLSPGTAGANALPGITDTPLPAGVLAAFNGQTISIAASDILPVDARFASYATLAPCGPLGTDTQFSGLGYGPYEINRHFGSIMFSPAPILSYFTQNYTNVNDFNVYGTDPASGNPIPAYSITPVGAIPVIVAVNTSNPNGFGSSQVANVGRADLGLLFTNLFLRTADAIAQPFAGTGATYYGLSALIPSPLSGSYNIFEHSITNSKELYRSLDLNNCTPDNADFVIIANPLTSSRNIGSNTGYRYRVIGTNEMLSELQATQDSIGFELWSAENFAGTTNLKYVSVDGVDPLFNTYSDGTIPQSGNGLLPNVTLSHVVDGSYPIWNEERLISSLSNAGVAATFASYTQSQLSFGAGATRPDFIPDSQLNVFHMHFAPFGVTFNATNTASDGPKVCGAGSNPEDGGDVGGLVLGLQAGADFCVMNGNYGAPGGVGPTDTASFGVHQ
ncbi:MAG: FG-GAP-like repeat-containing protein [Candidatus Sulfotelmatobacter sp.]|jgi:hypothetical protein